MKFLIGSVPGAVQVSRPVGQPKAADPSAGVSETASPEPVLVTFGAPAGSLGFATGTAHGRSADEQEDPR